MVKSAPLQGMKLYEIRIEIEGQFTAKANTIIGTNSLEAVRKWRENAGCENVGFSKEQVAAFEIFDKKPDAAISMALEGMEHFPIMLTHGPPLTHAAPL